MNIRPLTPIELSEYQKEVIARFASEKVQSEGVDHELAQKFAEEALRKALADNNGPHFIMRLEDGQTEVGVIWFNIRVEWGQPCLWLYDLSINAEHQRKGLGRMAMELLEEEARSRNISTIGLHVFGENKAAHTLYESQGFRPTSLVMRKDL